MNKSKHLPIIAVLILLVAIGASIFTNASKQDSTLITINGEAYTVGDLFDMAQQKTIEGESGVALDSLIEQAGVEDPQLLSFTLIGTDGYQKTVNWENMQNGILTSSRESVFSDLPKAFKVKEIVEIKVE